MLLLICFTETGRMESTLFRQEHKILPPAWHMPPASSETTSKQKEITFWMEKLIINLAEELSFREIARMNLGSIKNADILTSS